MKLCDEKDCHDAEDHAVPWHAKIHEDHIIDEVPTEGLAGTITVDGKCQTQI